MRGFGTLENVGHVTNCFGVSLCAFLLAFATNPSFCCMPPSAYSGAHVSPLTACEPLWASIINRRALFWAGHLPARAAARGTEGVHPVPGRLQERHPAGANPSHTLCIPQSFSLSLCAELGHIPAVSSPAMYRSLQGNATARPCYWHEHGTGHYFGNVK